jgi:hypothetical protein
VPKITCLPLIFRTPFFEVEIERKELFCQYLICTYLES